MTLHVGLGKDHFNQTMGKNKLQVLQQSVTQAEPRRLR